MTSNEIAPTTDASRRSDPAVDALRFLTPAARAKRAFPGWSILLAVVSTLVSILDHWIPFEPLTYAHMGMRLVAVVGAIAVAMWLEDRLYAWMLGRHIALRVAAGLVTPVLGAVIFLPTALVLGILGSLLGDQGTVVSLLFVMTWWFCSASVGSLLVVFIDGVVSAVLHDFRSRVQLAVLGLLSLMSALAVGIYGVGRAIAEKLRTMTVSDMPEGFDVDLGEGKISEAEMARLLNMSETSEVVAFAFFTVMVALTLPAVMSATGKIAEAVMERLHPLQEGFRHVAQGDLAVRVEEKGSRDFVRISRGFNRMTEALSETLASLDLRNRELSEVNAATRRFVPFAFLRLLRRESIREVRRGDQTALEISILFCDIRGFTPLAERLGPEATFGFINRYLGFMEPEIHARGGFINDFFGDGIMALFDSGPADAIDAGMSMLRAVDRLNGELEAEGASPIRVGIGIHTGPLMLGTIGGRDRLDCTVVGDPANLASRVEGMTKMYGASLLVTEAVLSKQVDRERFVVREVDRVRAKGKREPITVFEVLDEERDRDKIGSLDAFRQGLQAYREGRFDEASDSFDACVKRAPGDRTAALYVERCEGLRSAGISEGWDGVTDLTTK